MEHWQLNFEHNSTIKDENKNKKILKEDFTWPIVAFLVDGNFPDIDDCLSFLPDQSIKKEVERVIMIRKVSIMHVTNLPTKSCNAMRNLKINQ